MDLKRRKMLYYFFALIFLVCGAYLITSTQGLVIDWNKLQLVKTGGIYLKFIPSDASVFVDGKQVDESPGILNRGILIDDLVPRKYHVAVRKEGMPQWEKDFIVTSGTITPASAIRLWNGTIPYERIATATIPYFFSAGNTIITKNDKGNLVSSEKELRGSTIFAGRSDSKWIVTQTANDQLFFVDAENPESAVNLQEIFNSLKIRQLELPGIVKIKNALIHPFSEEKVIVATEQSLYTVDMKKIMIEKLTTSTTTIDFLIARGGSVFGISKNGNVQGSNLILKNEFNFSIGTTTITEVAMDDSGSRIAFKDADTSLFLYERGMDSPVKIGAMVKTFSLSSDGKKVVWINGNRKTFVYYIEKDDGDLKLPEGSITQLSVPAAYIQKDTKVFWIPKFPAHAFIETNGVLVALETDPRGKTNTATLIGESRNIFLDDNMRLNVIKNDGSFFSLSIAEIK